MSSVEGMQGAVLACDIPGLVALSLDAFDIAAAYSDEVGKLRGNVHFSSAAASRLATLALFVEEGPAVALHMVAAGAGRYRSEDVLPYSWDVSPEEWRLLDV